jgi:imidazolonepropionase-like amidohydrolase
MRQVVVGGPLWNTSSGAFEEGMGVLVDSGRIAAVARAADLPADDSVLTIDVAGGHVIPGLIDCHYHLISRTDTDATVDLITESVVEGVMSAARILEAGVTSVRDPGCKHRGIYTLRRLIEEGKIRGPRAFVSGPNPTGNSAPKDWRNLFVDGVEAMRSAVRQEWRAGADFIKLILSRTSPESEFTFVLRYLTDAEIEAAISEAHLLGVRTSAHCEGISAARAAVNAGIDCLEHALSLDAELAAQMAEQGTAYVPTRWVFLTENELKWGDIGPAHAEMYRERIEEEHRRALEVALREGVLIGAGTDSLDVVPTKDVLVCELEALVAGGMTHRAVLDAATINAASIMGREKDVGSLEEGKFADLVTVDGDPMEDLRALARPTFVMKGGIVEVDLRGDRQEAERVWRAFPEPPLADEGTGRGHWLI